MRKRLIILLVSVYFPFFIHAQYSNYYNVETNNKHDLRGEVNINQNINVRGRVNTTIETIDYGALANANAQNEANRIQQLKLQIEQKQYQDQREKQLAIIENSRELEITQNPLKALNYGEHFKQKVECRDYYRGIKRFEVDVTLPHKSLFKLLTGSGIVLQNVSTNGIITEIIYEQPFYTIQKTEFSNEEYSEVEKKRLNNQISYYQNTEKPKRKDFQNRELYLKAKGYYISICDSLDNIIVRKVPINNEQKNDHLRVGEKFLEYGKKAIIYSYDENGNFRGEFFDKNYLELEEFRSEAFLQLDEDGGVSATIINSRGNAVLYPGLVLKKEDYSPYLRVKFNDSFKVEKYYTLYSGGGHMGVSQMATRGIFSNIRFLRSDTVSKEYYLPNGQSVTCKYDSDFFVIMMDTTEPKQNSTAKLVQEQIHVNLEPNPLQLNNTLQVHSKLQPIRSVFVLDVKGNKLKEQLRLNTLKTSMLLDQKNGFKAGVYFVRIEFQNGESTTQKIVVTE